VNASLLMGGGHMSPGDLDANDTKMYQWLVAQSGAQDAVVLTADSLCTDDDWFAYGEYMVTTAGARSCTCICFAERSASFVPEILSRVKQAALIFMTGGDQARYYNFWRDSPVSAVMNRRALAGSLCLGGESAGLAVQGHFLFAGLGNHSVTSATALRDPMDPSITLRDNLFTLPLVPLVTDTHFKQRDRMGRLVTFVARLYAADRAVFGVGVSEHTGILVDLRTGRGIVAGAGPVNIVGGLAQAPQVMRAGAPLTVDSIPAMRLQPGDTVDLSPSSSMLTSMMMLTEQQQQQQQQHAYMLHAQRGVLTSTGNGGSLY
jgi:beta-aspartyl-peptidase (threonine type)